MWGQVAIGIGLLVLGTILGVFWTEYLKRPKLRVVGSSGVGREAFLTQALRIGNRPAFLGIRMGETVIVGRRIGQGFQKGLAIDRNTAKECTAWLIDRETKKRVAGLFWHRPDSTGADLSVSIEPGEYAELWIFARLKDEPLAYFPYRPSDRNTLDPEVPAAAARIHESREFMIEVNYSYGQQRLLIPVSVEKQLDGRLRFAFVEGSSSF